MKKFIIIDIRNPTTPKIKIPIADTFVIVSNSFLVGFFQGVPDPGAFNKKGF